MTAERPFVCTAGQRVGTLAKHNRLVGALRTFPALQLEARAIKTPGNNILDPPPSKIGDKGLLTKETDGAARRVNPLNHRFAGPL